MTINETIQPIWDRWSKQDNSVNTYCNLFVSDVMKHYDYHGFEGKVANSIIEIMRIDKNKWLRLDDTPQEVKGLIIACRSAIPHGHVCVLLEGNGVYSQKWGKTVPMCANVGKENHWQQGVNFAFKCEPEYFLYIA